MMEERPERWSEEMQRLDWSLSRKVTQDIKTQPQINHYRPFATLVPLASSLTRYALFLKVRETP